MKELGGKVAVVTGAASGIGRALSDAFAAEGMHVVMADIEDDALEAAAKEVGASGTKVLAVRTDVSKGADVDALAARTVDEFGTFHVVCNNAGVGSGGTMWELTEADWAWVLGVNLWGVIHGIRAFVPRLVEQNEGHVVNTGSIAGLTSAPMMGPYNASKHAVVTISETLQRELALNASTVRVSVLCPGFVQTRIAESDRNRPEHLRNPVEPEMSEVGRELMKQIVASGLPAAEVARQVVDAVKHERFYVLPHPEMKSIVRTRMDDILEERAPAAEFFFALIDPIPPTIEWRDGVVRLIDQRRLPGELVFIDCRTVDELCDAIGSLAVRGAPALGAAGAMGVALAVRNGEPLDAAAARLRATRPTAVNLAWGVDRARRAEDPEAEAVRIAVDDVERNRRMGAHGAALLHEGVRPLTHCNAGSLACVGWGTALGVVRAAHDAGLRPQVWVGETRPVLQGARLTAWELSRLGIAYTLVADGAAAALMADGEVDCVLVGADRIAANGDVANKVGTYGLAVLAHHHGVAFYVVAPRSTFDSAVPDGASIPIERRSSDEVLELAGHRVAPAGAIAENRAFDITPAALVTAYVTEDGVHRGRGH